MPPKKKGGIVVLDTTTGKVKNAGKQVAKAVAKAEKKAKIAKKIERKAAKKATKLKDEDADDQDLEAILDKMRQDWESSHKVTEELVEGPPSQRANATLVPCPSGNYIWCIGGEFFSEDNKAHFYNDVFRYSPEKDEWRKYVSPTCPGPRSAHAVAASPAGGGKIFLFGGEFSSLNQATFHHYRDFWCFDISTHSWDRIEAKVMPSARSGHRMAMWKHFVVLFGGFYDPGRITKYLNDLWLFDTQEHKWKEIVFQVNQPSPSSRSGFSFLSTPEGILLHGGYCKDYSKGKRPVGVMLEDTWFLRMNMPAETDKKDIRELGLPIVKWEKRKRTGYAPSVRSGCTMAQWVAKSTGVLFGGVTDEDVNEETLESVFHNDLYGYQIAGNGRWVSMTLRRPKQKGGSKKKTKNVSAPPQQTKPKIRNTKNDSGKESDSDQSRKSGGDSDSDEARLPAEKPWVKAKAMAEASKSTPTSTSALTPTSKLALPQTETVDHNDPNLTVPLPRYNAMLAVLRNTLYIYGGILEKGSREYTLDDFHSLALDKLDRYVCLRPVQIDIPETDKESSSEGDDSDSNVNSSTDTAGSGSDSEGVDSTLPDVGDEDPPKVPTEKRTKKNIESNLQEMEGKPVKKSRKQIRAEKEAAVADLTLPRIQEKEAETDVNPNDEEKLSTPLPGETIALFYARSRSYWAQKASEKASGATEKELRGVGFELAKERYIEYKPTLESVERIMADAGLGKEEMQAAAKNAASGNAGSSSQSRNRR